MTATIPEAPTRPEELIEEPPLPVPTPVLTGEILVPHVQTVTLPTNDEWRMLAHQANLLANSETVPRHLVGKPRATMAVILKGRELGLAPIQAVSSIHFIEGTPTLSAHLMSALVKRAGHELWVEHSSAESCTMKAQRRRPDGSLGPIESITWTIQQAEKANLLRKDNWKYYPDAMLRARATTALCRMSFADVLVGTWYTPEELGARVDAAGNITVLPTHREALEAVGSLDAAEDDPAMRASGEPAPTTQPPVRDVDGTVPDDGLDADTVDGEVVETPLDRSALWAEYLDQARIAGQSPTAFANRWAAAHKRSFTTATNAELAAFVSERRGYIADLLRQNPAAGENKPTGKQPACPPDPEAPAESEPTADGGQPEGDPAGEEPGGAVADAPAASEPPTSDPSPEQSEPVETPTEPREGETAPEPVPDHGPPAEAPPSTEPVEGTQETMDAPDTPV